MTVHRSNRRWLIALGLVFLVATVWVSVGLFNVLSLACLGQPDGFDAEGWRAADPEDRCGIRSAMVDDLIAGKELRPGRPRAEVERLLGPTEDTDYWLAEEEGLVYVTSCFIDCDWLVIEFDDQQRLVEALTRQD